MTHQENPYAPGTAEALLFDQAAQEDRNAEDFEQHAKELKAAAEANERAASEARQRADTYRQGGLAPMPP